MSHPQFPSDVIKWLESQKMGFVVSPCNVTRNVRAIIIFCFLLVSFLSNLEIIRAYVTQVSGQ